MDWTAEFEDRDKDLEFKPGQLEEEPSGLWPHSPARGSVGNPAHGQCGGD